MNIRKMLLSVFAGAFLAAQPSQSYAGEPPSIGTVMFLAIYAQCNGGDPYPFAELIKGAAVPESELYPRNKSSYEVSKCIYEKLKIPVRFPNSVKKNDYRKHGADLYADARSPMAFITTLDHMVEDGAFDIDPEVKKQLDGTFRDLDNDSALMKQIVKRIVEKELGRTIDLPESSDNANNAVNNPVSQDQGSVKPEKKKKYIYIPSK